ncbi:MAG: hypothetical protein M5U26_18380 [Planctomycetota bacterium]|nr:hypothetical protein [Planctomycetota bacterium]
MPILRGLTLLLPVLFACQAAMPFPAFGAEDAPGEDDAWKKHPALAEPDGGSGRGGKMVAADIKDPRILKELSRRFRATRPMRIEEKDGKTRVVGAEDFERRQEYLLRLLDYYWFSQERLKGMTRAEVEEIFGPLGGNGASASIHAGRDTFYIAFEDGRVSHAFYAMGY